MGAVHPTPATKISYGWTGKGQDKPLETTGSRTGLNIIEGAEYKRHIIDRGEQI